MSYTLIERKELTEAASSISIANIPQFYTDLVLLLSLRSTDTGDAKGSYYTVAINGGGTSTATRYLQGNGSSPSSGVLGGLAGVASTTGGTSNTFANDIMYIPNYTSSAAKSYSLNSVSENNATGAYQTLVAGLWNVTSAITTLAFTPSVGNFVAGSSISLYGINRQQAIGTPKAIGGTISFANGYWYHAFTGSGTFFAQEDLTVDALVVGGGGGGGAFDGGGGGAGGYRSSNSVVLNKNTAYPVTIGSGGPGGVYYVRGNGEPTSFLNITALGGGGGGTADSSAGGAEAGASGASGGGARGGRLGGNTGGAGTSGQGNNGGSSAGSSGYGSGGGGGAGGAGSNGTTSSNGSGGPGLAWLNGSYYAGGGGGASLGYGISTPGSGGIGGGGSAGNTASAGTANTGGGGGADADSQPGGNGGSGVVIIRYKA